MVSVSSPFATASSSTTTTAAAATRAAADAAETTSEYTPEDREHDYSDDDAYHDEGNPAHACGLAGGCMEGGGRLRSRTCSSLGSCLVGKLVTCSRLFDGTGTYIYHMK